MRKPKPPVAPRRPELTDEEIRDYAFHLYQQSGCIPGRDLDNWLEAKACLEAHIPKHHAHMRLHRHRHPRAADGIAIVTLEGETVPLLDELRLSGDRFMTVV